METHSSDAVAAFAEMLKHLCMRPKMYTFDGSFREVVVYLHGYMRGSKCPAGEIGLESGMEPFGRWLASRLGLNPNQAWHRILLEKTNGDEKRALETLWPCYEEYLAGTCADSSP